MERKSRLTPLPTDRGTCPRKVISFEVRPLVVYTDPKSLLLIPTSARLNQSHHLPSRVFTTKYRP